MTGRDARKKKKNGKDVKTRGGEWDPTKSGGKDDIVKTI